MTAWRLGSVVATDVPTPVIVDGLPTLPAHVGVISSTATARRGANHIRAVTPAPVWDGSGYVNPPPATQHPWTGRWVVDDLPDPPAGGFYWLGTPSGQDGSSGIGVDARHWRAHGSTPHAPAWHSFYPYKPSVRAVNSYLPDGNVVTHPKGVHFNPTFAEHMWLDWGGARRQPFTWVIAGMIANYPSLHYIHYLLDSGRDPDSVGFPRLQDWQVGTERKIADGLEYRTLLSYSPDEQRICTRLNAQGPRTVRARTVANHNPRMFFGVYNGASSYVGDYAPGGRRRSRGRVDNGADQFHRYYVLGRRHGWISQEKSSHLLLFEIRYWSYALSLEELDDQYGQLSSTYKFDHYRRVK